MNRDQPQHHPLHVVIPVKPFAEGKSRLAGALTPAGRFALNRQLYVHTLARAEHFAGPSHTTVISRSAEVLELARARGFGALTEPEAGPGGDGLNAAVRCGTRHARALGARALLVMPVDLPWGHADDLRWLVAGAAPSPVCLLVADHHGWGTNLLFQSPVQLDDYAFGPGSLARHQERARQAGLLPRVVHGSVFAFDIDDLADYQRWRPRTSMAITPQTTPHTAPLPLAWAALRMS